MTWRVAAAGLAALFLLPAVAVPARAADPRWDVWQLLLWQDRTPAQMDGLRALGFTGAKLGSTGGVVNPADLAKRVHAGLPFYLENVATDFYSAYHRYTAGKAVNHLYEEARAAHRADPASLAPFMREPSLSDPAALDAVQARLAGLVRAQAGQHPLFYNLADESGIADLAAAWDFDLSPASLAGFRLWLRGQYPDLAALNQEWGTDYAAWDAVQPMSTDAAVRRTDDNFAAWSDFKAWMDVAFARAVRTGTEAVHEADPGALSALEGGQIPGWGGYDYSLLARAVDVMEIYDAGEALDLALAFNPALIPLRTTFATGPRETSAAWHNVLHGGRGAVVWDENDDIVGPDGMAGPRGLELAALARAIRPVAAVLHESRPSPDPVAVLYSQASFRIGWLLDRRAGDHDWAARDAEREYDDNAWRASRRVLTERLAGLGIMPRIVSGAAGLGEESLRGVRVLFLPHATALSDSEVAAIKAFERTGGTVLADTEPGLFDGHGRRRDALPLPEVGHPAAVRVDAGGPPDPGALQGMETVLRAAGVRARASMLGPDQQPAAGVEARWFAHPQGQVLSLQAAVPWGAPSRLVVRLPGRARVSDVRAGGAAVVTDRLEVALDPVEPTVLMVAPLP